MKRETMIKSALRHFCGLPQILCVIADRPICMFARLSLSATIYSNHPVPRQRAGTTATGDTALLNFREQPESFASAERSNSSGSLDQYRMFASHADKYQSAEKQFISSSDKDKNLRSTTLRTSIHERSEISNGNDSRMETRNPSELNSTREVLRQATDYAIRGVSIDPNAQKPLVDLASLINKLDETKLENLASLIDRDSRWNVRRDMQGKIVGLDYYASAIDKLLSPAFGATVSVDLSEKDVRASSSTMLNLMKGYPVTVAITVPRVRKSKQV